MILLDQKISENIWKITSECVFDDHYSLSNLISSDESKRRIGFMAFSVSKPPITIVLECKLKINLECLNVHSVLGSLKSTRFQVMVEFFEDNKHKTRTIADISLETEHTGFCMKTSQSTQTDEESLKYTVVDAHLLKYLRDLNKIILVIKDSHMKRAPVLKKLEIFGTFSDKNDTKEVTEVLQLLNPTIPEQSTSHSSFDTQKEDIEDTFKIPEDFLDAITMELLNLPYILPSGSIVDETTLEKHKRNEASYGRHPSDPFTGLLFTPNSQPKFDASLKMRLDDFKLKNSHELEIRSSGRSVGRKEKLCEPSTSKQFNNHISKKIKLSKESSLDDIIQSIYRNKQISSFINPQIPQSSANICVKCNLKDDNTLYKISTCCHVFCKKCLVQLNSVCSICSKTFENKHVVKLNL